MSGSLAWRLLAATVAASVTATAAAAAQAAPGVVDLGTLGGDFSDVGDMNDLGWIAGRAADPNGTPHAVLWRDGRIMRLDIPGAADQPSNALDVNNRGQAAVNVGVPGDVTRLRTWVWQRGEARELPTLPGGGGTQARRINERGDVAGNAVAADGTIHPVRWRHGRIEDLGLPPGAASGFAFGINDEGDVSGSIQRGPDDFDLAFVWHQGHYRTYAYGQANVIDDAGRAAGRYDDSVVFRSDAGWWERDGSLHDLGVLSGESPDGFGWIFATDGAGDWGGASTIADGTGAAFVAHLHGPMLALPGIDGRYGEDAIVHGLNRRGDAAGSSLTTTGESHATLWRDAFAMGRPSPPEGGRR